MLQSPVQMFFGLVILLPCRRLLKRLDTSFVIYPNSEIFPAFMMPLHLFNDVACVDFQITTKDRTGYLTKMLLQAKSRR